MSGMEGKGRVVLDLVVGALAVAAIILVVASTKVEAGGDAIVVKGLYGVNVPYASIGSASLIDDLPPGLIRVNGIGLGFMEIGHYRSGALGKVRLAVLKKESPYLLIETKTERIIVGLGSERNRELLAQVESEAARK